MIKLIVKLDVSAVGRCYGNMGRTTKSYIKDAIIEVAPDQPFTANDLVLPLEEILDERLSSIRIGHHLRALVICGLFESKKLRKHNIYWRSKNYARI